MGGWGRGVGGGGGEGSGRGEKPSGWREGRGGGRLGGRHCEWPPGWMDGLTDGQTELNGSDCVQQLQDWLSVRLQAGPHVWIKLHGLHRFYYGSRAE